MDDRNASVPARGLSAEAGIPVNAPVGRRRFFQKASCLSAPLAMRAMLGSL